MFVLVGGTSGDRNLLTSCMGGLIGLLLSFGLLSLCKSLFFSGDVSLTHDMLIQPLTFVAAFFLR